MRYARKIFASLVVAAALALPAAPLQPACQAATVLLVEEDNSACQATTVLLVEEDDSACQAATVLPIEEEVSACQQVVLPVSNLAEAVMMPEENGDRAVSVEAVMMPADNGDRAVSVEAVEPENWLAREGEEGNVSFRVSAREDAKVRLYVHFVSDTTLMGRCDTVATIARKVSLKAGESKIVRVPLRAADDKSLTAGGSEATTVPVNNSGSEATAVPVKNSGSESVGTKGNELAPRGYQAREKDLAPGFYQLCTHVSSDVSTHASGDPGSETSAHVSTHASGDPGSETSAHVSTHASGNSSSETSTHVSSDFDLESFNVGICPERIVSPQTRRADFDEFWNATLAELAEVPLDAEYELLKDRCSPERNVYRVTFRSFGGVRVGGILAIPVAEGKYPAYIEYMGYGAEVYQYNGADRPDAIQFLVSVRDQGIYKDCKPGENGRWIDRGLSSKEGFYYRGAFCDVVRAVDFIASLDKTDPTRIFGLGESQGGAFTWIAASLDHRFRAIAPAVPFLSDYEDYAKIVWWPMHEMFEISDKNGIGRNELLEMLSYFDVKNFTDRIECPVKMAFGLQDPTCPPHTNFAGYNNVKTEKSYRCEPLCGHGMWEIQAWSEERDAWFKSFATKL